MANVTIKLSAAAFNARESAALTSGDVQGVSGNLNTALTIIDLIDDRYSYYSSVSATSSKVTYRFADGASYSMSGRLDMPYLGYGYGTATLSSFSLPGKLALEASGSVRVYFYSSGGYDTRSGRIDTLKLSLLDGSASPLGKSVGTITGSIYFDASGNLSGTLTSLTTASSKIVKSSEIQGNFTINSGNLESPSGYYADGVIAKYANVSGSLTRFTEKYYDGSLISVDASASPLQVANGASLTLDRLSDPANFTGADMIDIALPSVLTSALTVRSGAGSDTIKLSGGGGSLHADAGDGDDTVTLVDGAHAVSGGEGNDTLVSGKGIDTLLGGAGNDVYSINDVADVVSEATAIGTSQDAGGTDTVVSGLGYVMGDFIENLTLTGKAAANGTGNGLRNFMMGNDGANGLSGGDGADTIDGGLGKDTLSGGAGTDLFIFSTKLGKANVDTITDFTAGIDKIELEIKIFAKLQGSIDFLAVGSVSNAPNRFIVYDSATGKLSYDADGSGKAKPVDIALIGAGLNLTVNDFMIV